MANTKGKNGVDNGEPPSDDVLRAALLSYASLKLSAKQRIQNLADEHQYHIKLMLLKTPASSGLWERVKRRISFKRREPDPLVVFQPPSRSTSPSRSTRSWASRRFSPTVSVCSDRPPTPPPKPDHNDRLPINRLPPDIFADIFLLLASEPTDGGYDHSWVACSHICTSWRRIALGTPLLWSHVVFTSHAWVKACIQRSKSSPLIVEAEVSTPRVECLVYSVLKRRTALISRIYLTFSILSERIVKVLAGPFPQLTSLSIENCTWRALDIPSTAEDPPFPALRSLMFWTETPYLPPLPSQLISLEIYGPSWPPIGWHAFALALGRLPHLTQLKLSGFSAPSPFSHIQSISLPNLRDIYLGGTPNECAGFLDALDSPKLRRFDIRLTGVDELPVLYRTFSTRVPVPPKCMLLDFYATDNINSATGPVVLRDAASPNVILGTASIAFAYNNSRYPREKTLDGLLAKILGAVFELEWLEAIECLVVHNWTTSPAAQWRPLLSRLTGLQTLDVRYSPPAGLFWALVQDVQEEKPHEEEEHGSAEAVFTRVNLSAGSWLPYPMHATTPTALSMTHYSYVDLDNARLIELVVCYLESRLTSGIGRLPRLTIDGCCGYTGAEVKFLRRLVDTVVWDGWGMYDGTYNDQRDAFGALTIHHTSLAGQRGYEELNVSEEERRDAFEGFLWQ
ncbi:hypothetical protein FB45DRAFT_1035237 [Roridomyces roridus]|uniref:F-box domain-containing protein n=1 Tax=Roridomyces roridus TaxID=1738132 RepID=A0AAD7BBS4_9AGAR|nr:hypothetical protein FB45DRAFT_1035237 [Roridomyces roridus]